MIRVQIGNLTISADTPDELDRQLGRFGAPLTEKEMADYEANKETYIAGNNLTVQVMADYFKEAAKTKGVRWAEAQEAVRRKLIDIGAIDRDNNVLDKYKFHAVSVTAQNDPNREMTLIHEDNHSLYG